MARQVRTIPYRTSPQREPVKVSERLQELSDEALVLAIVAGSDRGFTELHRRYRSRIFVFAMQIIGDMEKTEDVVQETFIRVHRHLHRFDERGKFSTWIYLIAKRLSWNAIRDRRRCTKVFLFQTLEETRDPDGEQLEFADAHLGTERLYEERNLHELVKKSVAELPVHFRIVFHMREMEGRTYNEMARIMGCSLGTMKSRVHRAREAFAEIIGPHLD